MLYWGAVARVSCWTPDQAVQEWTLTGVIVLCSWARLLSWFLISKCKMGTSKLMMMHLVQGGGSGNTPCYLILHTGSQDNIAWWATGLACRSCLFVTRGFILRSQRTTQDHCNHYICIYLKSICTNCQAGNKYIQICAINKNIVTVMGNIVLI